MPWVMATGRKRAEPPGLGPSGRAGAGPERGPGSMSRCGAAESAMPEGTTRRALRTDDGALLRLFETGHGPPVLFLHGITHAAVIWAKQFEELSPTQRVLALDLRGHGASRPGHAGISIERCATDVAQLLEALDLSGVVVVGHSMGGMVAIELVADHPEAAERVAGLVLVGASAAPLGSASVLLRWPVPNLFARRGQAPGPLGASPEPMAAVQEPQAPEEGAGSCSRSRALVARAWALGRLSFGADPAPAQMRLAWSVTAATPLSSLPAAARAAASFDRRRDLGRISVPCEVLVGEKDRLLCPSHSLRLAAGLGAARLTVVKGAGHMVMLESPSCLAAALSRLTKQKDTRRIGSQPISAGPEDG